MVTPLVVSFCTPGYMAHGAALEKSCDAQGIEHEVMVVEDRGSWNANCRYKAAFIRERREAHPGRPVLWIDADAEVLAPLDGLAEAVGGADMAAGERCGWTLSGTVWFSPTPGADLILHTWERIANRFPVLWDQAALQAALHYLAQGPHPPVVRVLPPAFIYADAITSKDHPEVEPVIYHHMASRKTRDKSWHDGNALGQLLLHKLTGGRSWVAPAFRQHLQGAGGV